MIKTFFGPLLLGLIIHVSAIAQIDTNASLLASVDDTLFSTFKQHTDFSSEIENFDYQTGENYLKIILKDYPELTAYFDQFRTNDAVGSPKVYSYGEYGSFSPATLHYIKVAGDLFTKYKDVSRAAIVEVGGTYGGQCKILHDLCGFGSYTIIDQPECNALTEKYLHMHGIDTVQFIDINHLDGLPQYDIVIGNHQFASLGESTQKEIFNNIIDKTPSGHITYHLIPRDQKKKMTPHALASLNSASENDPKKALRSIKLEDMVFSLLQNKRVGFVEGEQALSEQNSFLLTWGKDQTEIEAPLILPITLSGNRNAITHGTTSTRMGDNLLSYFHAKWLAHKYSLPFYYKDFINSHLFCLDHQAKPIDWAPFKQRIVITKESDIDLTQTDTIFEVPYFPEFRLEYDEARFYHAPYYNVTWKNKSFREDLINSLKPKTPVKTSPVSKETISIGVHVRTGGGLDGASSFSALPLKFPSENYYISQIKKIARVFQGKSITVYLLTDDQNPKQIAEKYEKSIGIPNLKIEYRKKGNGPSSNILEDFLTIPTFDCLIIPQSNFSYIASKIKDYKILVYPINHKKIRGKETVTAVVWELNP